MQVKNVLDFTHDLKKDNARDLEEILIEIIESRPFGDHKFYIHSFLKDTDDVYVKRFLHHPRLTKPMPSPNSRLFKVNPKVPEDVEVMWILPGQESMHLFQKGKLFQDELINDSIREFMRNPEKLRQPEPDDVSDEEARRIYSSLKKMPSFCF